MEFVCYTRLNHQVDLIEGNSQMMKRTVRLHVSILSQALQPIYVTYRLLMEHPRNVQLLLQSKVSDICYLLRCKFPASVAKKIFIFCCYGNLHLDSYKSLYLLLLWRFPIFVAMSEGV